MIVKQPKYLVPPPADGPFYWEFIDIDISIMTVPLALEFNELSPVETREIERRLSRDAAGSGEDGVVGRLGKLGLLTILRLLAEGVRDE